MQNKRLFVILLAVGLIAAWLQPFAAQASVTLSDFRAQSGSSRITIYWETATELDNLGFHLWRGQTVNLDNASRLTTNLIPSQVGGQPTGASYEYEDNTAQPDILYSYWLEAVDVNGSSEFYGPEQAIISGSNPLGTATPGGNNPTPLPTSTISPPNTAPPINTAAPSPTPRPQIIPTATPQPLNTPLPTATLAVPDPTKISATEVAPIGAPPTTGEPPISQADPIAGQPTPTAVTGVRGAGAESEAGVGDEGAPTHGGDESQVQVVGGNTPVETPSPVADLPPVSTEYSLSPVALGALAAGILFSIGGIITVMALVRRRQNDK